ncbi:hypothetical protein ACFY12_10895 [Streptomyces sp. NPDC001339]
MRPAEVIHLRLEQCHLPETEWGMLKFLDGVREQANRLIEQSMKE